MFEKLPATPRTPTELRGFHRGTSHCVGSSLLHIGQDLCRRAPAATSRRPRECRGHRIRRSKVSGGLAGRSCHVCCECEAALRCSHRRTRPCTCTAEGQCSSAALTPELTADFVPLCVSEEERWHIQSRLSRNNSIRICRDTLRTALPFLGVLHHKRHASGEEVLVDALPARQGLGRDTRT
jgi:hypothetical protein